MKMSKFKMAFAVVLICLCVSVGFNIYQYLGTEHSPKIFVFTNEYIRNDTQVRMEVTFDWQLENLSMTVTVNDDEYNENDYLGVVFDKSNNGTIDLWNEDEPYVLYANNMTRPQGAAVLCEWGGLSWAIINAVPSCYHTCTFNEKTGYTFKMTFSRQDIKVGPPTPIHICFADYERWTETRLSNRIVWVQFEVK
jgi:hypothetical protein